MSAARERFLRAIAERLPTRRLEDIRLFAPLRQGGIESGVAVVTAALDAEPGAEPGAPPRCTIYRAQYRLTLKGVERGKWEMTMTEEADAPDGTVDEVVRGVLRRAGEEAEPERLAGEALHAALADGEWTGAR
ncbi:MAG TPA: hypothetical protein VMT93_09620 [Gemmatimonadaceae bacterium]|nr:hypothetical protein [Gemmatimonadaceae bacterium]